MSFFPDGPEGNWTAKPKSINIAKNALKQLPGLPGPAKALLYHKRDNSNCELFVITELDGGTKMGRSYFANDMHCKGEFAE